jgi:hypothetical protein
VKRRVVGPYQVCHEGQPYVAGDQVTVPAEMAEQWIRAGWVERVPVSQKAKRKCLDFKPARSA